MMHGPINSRFIGNSPQFETTHQEITSAMVTPFVLNEYVASGNGTTTPKHVANLKKWKKCSGRKIVREMRRVLIN